jgi:hypothetical protein
MPTVPSTKPFSIGTTVLNGTSGSVLFVDSNSKVAQDNSNLQFNDGTNSLIVGGNCTASFFYGDGSNLTNLESSAWYDGAELPTADLGDANDYYLQYTSGDYYKKVVDTWTLMGNLRPPSSSYQGNYLVSGGQIVWVSGYIFSVSPATYYIAGSFYSSPLTLVTLDTADVSNDRIDLIVLNIDSEASFVTGTPSPSPVEPDTEPGEQLKLSFILVDANSTEPGVSQTMIYQEDLEWVGVVSHATINKASTNSPRTGSKCIEGTTVLRNQYVQFTSPSDFDLNSKELFVFYIKSKGAWAGGSINITWRLASTVKGVTISVTDGFAGFDSSNTSTYQQIAIPTAVFGIPISSLVNRVRFTISKASGSIGFHIDDCWLQEGITTPPSVDLSNYALITYVEEQIELLDADNIAYVNQTNAFTAKQTITGATITGSSSDPTLTVSQTWNTSGVPEAILIDINDTASHANSAFISGHTDGDDIFHIRKDGTFYVQNAIDEHMSWGLTELDMAVLGGYIIRASNDLTIESTFGEVKFYFDDADRIAMNLAEFYPSTNNTISVGTDANRFSTGYFTNLNVITTPSADDSDTSVANTAFVQQELANVRIGTIGCNFNGNGSIPVVGSKFRVEVPYACTINQITMLGDLSGAAVVDLWVDSYANYEPLVGDSICGSNKPTITATSNKSQQTSFTGWTTTTLTAGSILVFYLESITTITDLTIIIKVTKT